MTAHPPNGYSCPDDGGCPKLAFHPHGFRVGRRIRDLTPRKLPDVRAQLQLLQPLHQLRLQPATSGRQQSVRQSRHPLRVFFVGIHKSINTWGVPASNMSWTPSLSCSPSPCQSSGSSQKADRERNAPLRTRTGPTPTPGCPFAGFLRSSISSPVPSRSRRLSFIRYIVLQRSSITPTLSTSKEFLPDDDQMPPARQHTTNGDATWNTAHGVFSDSSINRPPRYVPLFTERRAHAGLALERLGQFAPRHHVLHEAHQLFREKSVP